MTNRSAANVKVTTHLKGQLKMCISFKFKVDNLLQLSWYQGKW